MDEMAVKAATSQMELVSLKTSRDDSQRDYLPQHPLRRHLIRDLVSPHRPPLSLAVEMPYLARVGGPKQLVVEAAAARGAVDILKEAGIKILEAADPRPVV
ncbi:hypothetical protein CSUB01_04909 [Colletotrichum sublineola]|uniref:Uncharacterized protein n=1 Tax=Colletotrichum sublineola TaxID=1173701 RepID=A0A066X0E8_COLSU|nr:hypothetical protein CSUB01_04909 [Colletotrichum sublineola]